MDSGSYSASSRLQAAGLQPAIKLFEEAAEVVPLPRPPQPIVIADYGAATGHNSLLPVGAAIAVLRKRTRPEHSVLVAHTDLAVQQRESGLDVMGDSVAEPRSGADSRPRAGDLQ